MKVQVGGEGDNRVEVPPGKRTKRDWPGSNANNGEMPDPGFGGWLRRWKHWFSDVGFKKMINREEEKTYGQVPLGSTVNGNPGMQRPRGGWVARSFSKKHAREH